MVDSLLYTSFESSNNALQKQNKPKKRPKVYYHRAFFNNLRMLWEYE